jgi:hypothetical protein
MRMCCTICCKLLHVKVAHNNIGTSSLVDQLLEHACSFIPVNQTIYYETTTRTADVGKICWTPHFL